MFKIQNETNFSRIRKNSACKSFIIIAYQKTSKKYNNENENVTNKNEIYREQHDANVIQNKKCTSTNESNAQTFRKFSKKRENV